MYGGRRHFLTRRRKDLWGDNGLSFIGGGKRVKAVWLGCGGADVERAIRGQRQTYAGELGGEEMKGDIRGVWASRAQIQHYEDERDGGATGVRGGILRRLKAFVAYPISCGGSDIGIAE
ncbi:hypothetical protein Tco_0901117 [Tanacetum coccineum]